MSWLHAGPRTSADGVGAARFRTPRRAWIACAAVLSIAVGVAMSHAQAASAATYSAQTVTVTSFDGTKLNVNFYPAAGLSTGQTAPTVLLGSAWDMPQLPSSIGNLAGLSIGSVSFNLNIPGPATLIADGYNVVTWDERGWFNSTGTVQVDSPQYEGRDVSAILDWLATQPAAQLDAPGDPHVGMVGASYGGGIQLSAAAIDPRIDVIEPNMSWNSLINSVYPNQVIKQGWGNLLCNTGTLLGARYAPALTEICASDSSGAVTPDEIAAGTAASPLGLVSQIKAPTLLLGGTVDTLFPLNEDLATYADLQAAGTPVKMMWYCGGHGVCNLPSGTSGYIVNTELNWLAKYLKGQNVDTGPAFEYLDNTGNWRSEPSYPVPASGSLSASGSGLLFISPTHSSGTLGVQGTPASNAVNVSIPAPSSSVDTLADPTVTLTYSGFGSKSTAPVFAQLVDTSAHNVLDNQVTPTLLTLNGQQHTVTLPLNLVTWNLTPSSRIELQITDDSDLYFPQRTLGFVQISKATVSIPTVAPGAAG